MLRLFIVVLALVLSPMATQQAFAADNGLIKKKSPYSVSKTLDRLEAVLKKKGITIALRWNHAERAKGVGILPKEMAINIGASGPVLRASGVEWDWH